MGAVLTVICLKLPKLETYNLLPFFSVTVLSLLGVIIGSKQISHSLTITSYSSWGIELQGKYLNGKETDFICFNFISQKVFLKI